MLTNLQLVAFAQNALDKKARYWYGTFWQPASTSLYNSKKGQYPNHYTSARAPEYKQHIANGKMVTDCAGLLKGFIWSQGGAIPSDYKNGFPDVNANTIITSTYCEKTGSISSIPDVPGLILWTNGHLGIYIGGGYAIEARGFAYGVVKTKVKDRTWKKWGKLKAKYLTYESGMIDPSVGGEPAKEPTELGARLLRYKAGNSLQRGADVAELQRALIALGFGKHLGTDGADGVFGQMTGTAVRAFQKAYGLGVDGEYGPKSHAKLTSLLNIDQWHEPTNTEPITEDDLPPEDPEAEPDALDSEEVPESDGYMGSGALNPYPIPTQIKRKGMRGATIMWIQWELLQSGYTIGKDGVDGDFGANTDKAVRKYQKAHSLTVDGEVGPSTRAALLEEAGLCEHDEPTTEGLPTLPAIEGSKNTPDISYYDGQPVWAKVNVPHIWIREGDSLRKRDPEFTRNVKGAVANQIPWSVYLFFRASDAKGAVLEVDASVARLKATGETPISFVLDVEVDSATKAAVKAAHARLRELLGPQVRIGLYIGHHLYASFKAVVPLFNYIWIPRYNKWQTPPAYPYDIWQGGFGSFAGIRSGRKEVDSNRPAPGRTWAQILAG